MAPLRRPARVGAAAPVRTSLPLVPSRLLPIFSFRCAHPTPRRGNAAVRLLASPVTVNGGGRPRRLPRTPVGNRSLREAPPPPPPVANPAVACAGWMQSGRRVPAGSGHLAAQWCESTPPPPEPAAAEEEVKRQR